jgi:hypothetical protein
MACRRPIAYNHTSLVVAFIPKTLVAQKMSPAVLSQQTRTPSNSKRHRGILSLAVVPRSSLSPARQTDPLTVRSASIASLPLPTPDTELFSGIDLLAE